MSITNLELIGDALRDINVISEVQTPSDEQGSYALRKLNQMMEAWRTDGVDIGWHRQTTIGATCPIPDWAELGVQSSLAVLIAPKYGASVSAELGAIAANQYKLARRETQKAKLDNVDMTHLPIGDGHYGQGYDITTDS